jgi:hypothetical protein
MNWYEPSKWTCVGFWKEELIRISIPMVKLRENQSFGFILASGEFHGGRQPAIIG